MASMMDSLQYDGGMLEQEYPFSAVDELWKELYQLPTLPLPPLCFTPRTTEPSTLATTPEAVSDTDYTTTAGSYTDNIMSNITEYKPVMEMTVEAEQALTNNMQPSPQQEEPLQQDCMWNGGILQIPQLSNSSTKSSVTDMLSNSQFITNTVGEDMKPNFVEPSAVFPVLKAEKRVLQASAETNSTRPMLCCSNSEEIDMVTVVTGPNRGQKSSRSKKKYSKKNKSKRSSRGGSHDSNESDKEVLCALHKVYERKRRNDLKNSFDILRSMIPDLKENQRRATKVLILHKAVDYIEQLKVNQKKIDNEYKWQNIRHRKLIERLAQVKNSLPLSTNN